jgi:hypothetical protein
MGRLWRVGRSGGAFGGVGRGIVFGALVFVYSGAVFVKTLWTRGCARGERWAFAMRVFNMSKSMFAREVRASERCIVRLAAGLYLCYILRTGCWLQE